MMVKMRRPPSPDVAAVEAYIRRKWATALLDDDGDEGAAHDAAERALISAVQQVQREGLDTVDAGVKPPTNPTARACALANDFMLAWYRRWSSSTFDYCGEKLGRGKRRRYRSPKELRHDAMVLCEQWHFAITGFSWGENPVPKVPDYCLSLKGTLKRGALVRIAAAWAEKSNAEIARTLILLGHFPKMSTRYPTTCAPSTVVSTMTAAVRSARRPRKA